jgi:DNA primase
MTSTLEKAKEVAKGVSILSYLSDKGIRYKNQGTYYRCSSPFSEDNNWSFTIYPKTNSFFDYSNGDGGDIIYLAMKLEGMNFPDAVHFLSNGEYDKYDPKKAISINDLDFTYKRYFNYNADESRQIYKYAKSRGLRSGFDYGIFFTKDDATNNWVRHPCLMFPHLDNTGKVIGCKMRAIEGTGNDRFRAKGRLGFYILENILSDSFEDTTVYLVESETSANSLWEYFREIEHNSVVISCGAVSSVPNAIPSFYHKYKLKIIIDYDGDEELYNQRLELYKHLGGEPIKLILPKGEDINSLWAKGKINQIYNLIF